MRRTPGPQMEEFGAEPVFVDASGRRRGLARTVGIAAGGLLAAYLAVLGFGLMTGSDVPMTPWPKPRPSRGAAPPTHERPDPRRSSHSPTPSPAESRTPSAKPSSGARSTARPATTASATTTRPGNSQATPPALGRSKRPHPQKP